MSKHIYAVMCCTELSLVADMLYSMLISLCFDDLFCMKC